MYKKYFKRIMDLSLSLLALIALSPVMAAVAVAVRIKMGSPVLFKQPRPGKDEKIFILYKFRTMIGERDKQGNLISDEDRVTKLGNFLRSTSLDELPELFNIIKGDMSIVGPRPLLVKYLTLYNDEQRKRHSILPGLTGWAQVNGRNMLRWDEKFKLDIEYTDKITFDLDLKIILLTFIKILKRDGITSETSKVNMEEFRGNN